MSEISTDWSREEFKAYLLLYAARSNYFESEEEKEIILGVVSPESYKHIHREIEHDNDYQSIEKILYNIRKFNYSKEEIHRLVEDVQRLFLSNGEVDLLESNFIHALRRLLE